MTRASSYGLNAYRAGDAHVTIVNRHHKANQTRRGLLAFHGAGGDADDYFTASSGASDLYAERHVAVMWGDFDGPYTFGNDDAITSVGEAWTWMKANLGTKTDQVILAGGSMGALVALNWARANPTLVACCVLTIPLLDLDTAYQEDTLGLRDEIGTAYGVTHPTALPGLATHSPVAYPDDVSFPVAIFSSDDDTAASNTAECQTWAAAVGNNVTVTSIGAQGHADDGSFNEAKWEFIHAYV